MKKIQRIKKNEEFSEIISKKKSVANQAFVIYFQKNQSFHHRIGISVSKKLGNAVIRNKIKRQVRMLIQQNFDSSKQIDYIIIIRKKFLDLTHEQRIKELHYLIKKIDKRMEI